MQPPFNLLMLNTYMLVRRCIDVRKRRLKNFHFQPKTNVNLTSETDVNVTSIQLILPAGIDQSGSTS